MLTQAGIPNPSNKKRWSPSTIDNILQISANDMGGQYTLAAVASRQRSSAFDLCLNNGELPRLNNSWVAVFYIVLGNFTVIGDHLFREEVDGVGFLVRVARLVTFPFPMGMEIRELPPSSRRQAIVHRTVA